MNTPADAPACDADRMVLIRAKVKLANAIDIVARAMPFHAEAMSAWTAKPDPHVGTCGLFWECGSIQLRYDPTWLNSLTVPELCGTLLHNCLHILFGHVHIECDVQTDERSLFIAADLTCNEFIKAFPLPGEPLLLEQFPVLAPLQSTRHRYELLRQLPEDDAGGGADDQLQGTSRDSRSSPSDTHEGWESIRRAGTAAKLAIVAATDRAMQKHGTLLDPATLRAIAAGADAGMAPGDGAERVESATAAWLDWRTILATLPPPRLHVQPTYSRPPRRQPEMAGIIPGRRYVSRAPILLVAIDVSSSMSSVILGRIKQEVRSLAAVYRVALIEIDTRVVRSQLLFEGEYRDPSLVDDIAHGRGGTSFDAAFAPEVLAWAGGSEDVDAVVYFTDGFGPPPAKRPNVPTIWVLSDERGRTRTPAPWGAVVSSDGRVVRSS